MCVNVPDVIPAPLRVIQCVRGSIMCVADYISCVAQSCLLAILSRARFDPMHLSMPANVYVDLQMLFEKAIRMFPRPETQKPAWANGW